jgi:pSer/pThr/pTyr-binding forkhead associated (FHA) protein
MTLALVEVLDRDGQVRQTLAVQSWPVAIGRAIDNDLVLADPHVAAHHLRLVAAGDDATPAIEVGATLNGVVLGTHRLRAGTSAALPPAGAAPVLAVGRTRLRVRLPGHALDAELPVAVPSPPAARC